MKTKRNLAAAVFAAFAIIGLPSANAQATKPAVKEVAPKDKKTLKPYPLATCVVSDEKLGEMGKPFVFEKDGQEIKLCCERCKAKFDKDPAKYLKKLNGK